MEQFKQKFELI